MKALGDEACVGGLHGSGGDRARAVTGVRRTGGGGATLDVGGARGGRDLGELYVGANPIQDVP